MNEQHVCTISFSDLPDVIFNLAGFLYNETGVKWEITLHGSKGYTDAISFSAEGKQAEENQTFLRFPIDSRLKKGGFKKSKRVAIYYSHEKGVRIAHN